MLGVFISMIMEHDPRPQRWALLKSFAKKTNMLLFPNLPIPKSKNIHFEKFGITAPLMTPNEEKYLLPKDAVLKNCIELKYRSMMMGTVAADMNSFFKKNSQPRTAYEIAKTIHHHRAQVYALIKTMQQLGDASAMQLVT